MNKLLSSPNLLLRLASMSSTSGSAGIHSMAFVTAPSEEVAKKLAQYPLIFLSLGIQVFTNLTFKIFSGLVTEKLAACVNIVPKITSV